ncbi:sensor histidine kinase [Streptomyces turgidiscabies]|uniref:histidine kinase n=1 Tax=Streptomyces turgidiscabies (strain Car8) TaxID=698760 RepID=L7EUD7_STRT8|nr:ATP-binding protein [Streptomyces turgidiscabies]ELP62005.1 ATPase/histidine kinase/DNA gyrase B/HSP90 domain protein [Streptomyces turgidiscabies Car8]MDX3495185.1 ATP-binding protein [Streptomyces turgidiscabies]GAQ71058.1 putative sensor histidine kinase TcrY [Streptomyces turgidiscabies]
MTVRLRGRSLRTRLLLFIGVTLAVVCAAMAVVTAFAQHRYLVGSLDDRVAGAVARSQGGAALHPELDTDLSFLDENGQPAGTLAARLDADGTLLSARVVARDAAPQDLTPTQREALAGIRADGSMHTRAVPGLGTYRITAVGGTAGNGVRVLTGLPMDDVQEMIQDLVVVEAVAAVVGLTIAGCVCAVVIRRQLRPLDRVAATAVEVSRAPLGRGEVIGLTRVPNRDTDPRSEVGQVGAALNRMIDHVESSLAERQAGEERMRRFLSDASHELRTPLASIAGYAELMNRGTQRIEPTLAWRRVSAESARMTGLVEDLLLLARLDEGRPLQSAEVDLAAVVAESVWDARAAGEHHNWQLALLLDSPALVAGDEVRLHQVVAKLLANARVHTPAGTTVVASVEVVDDRCVIRVRDDGPGIPPHLLPSVFERFTRADVSRARSGSEDGGSGLGLAIVTAVVAAHGGRIGVESAPGHTEFTIELPTASPAPQPTHRPDLRTAVPR